MRRSIHEERRQLLLTLLIFILIFLSRIPYINNPSAEMGELWRQTDTESIARNFLKYRFNIFYPQLNYDGVPPNYVQLEFQITTFLIALLYKLFGIRIWLARLVPIFFFMLSSWFLYLIAKRIFTVYQALSSVIIYSMLPITIYFSRAIMPEAALLCFFNGAFYFFLKWLDDERFSTLLYSAVFTCLSISQKPQSAFIGLAMILMCFDKFKLRVFRQWRLAVFAAISLLPPAIYFIWLGTFAKQKFVSRIAVRHILPNFLTALKSEKALDFYVKRLPESFTISVLALAFFALFTVLNKKERPIFYWAISTLLEAALIVSVIRFKYYLILLAPVLAILCAKLLGLLWSIRFIGFVIVLALLLPFGSYSARIAKKDFELEHDFIEAARNLNELTKPGDLIVISTFDPTLLTLSERAGWRANLKYHEEIPKEMHAEINYFIESGADYFLIYKNQVYDDPNGVYLKYINESFVKKAYTKNFILYQIK